MFRYTPADEQIIELIQYILRPDPAGYMSGQTFPTIFVNNDQDTQRSPIDSSGHGYIITPNMVLPLRTESDT